MTGVPRTCNCEHASPPCLQSEEQEAAARAATRAGGRWVWSRPAPRAAVGVEQAGPAGPRRAVCTSNLSPRIASPLQYDVTSRTWTFLGSTCTRRLSVCPRTLATLTHSGERVRVCACAVVALPRHSSRHGLDGRCMGPAVECYVSKEKTPVNSIECRGRAGVEGVSEVVVETPLLVTQW